MPFSSTNTEIRAFQTLSQPSGLWAEPRGKPDRKAEPGPHWLHSACRSQVTMSVRKKSSHCYYNENGLHDINVTWQSRRVDWDEHV